MSPRLAGCAAAAGAAVWAAARHALVARLGEWALGVGLGALALALRLGAPAPAAPPGPVALRLLEPPHGDARGCQAEVWIGGARPGRARLALPPDGCGWLPGQTAVGRLELRALRGPRNPGAGDARRRAARRGLHARARVAGTGLVTLSPTAERPAVWLERARRRIGEVLDPSPQPTRGGALLLALVLGDRQRLDAAVRDAFARSGTAHLLSVSGLHVAWVMVLTQIGVGWLLRRTPWLAWLRRARLLALLAGLGAALAYAALTGAAVPALRAAAMAAAAVLALGAGRRPASWNALVAAALVVLASDPAALFEASLWLSFSAVAGLLAWRIPPGHAAGLLHSTLAASLATAPLLAGLGFPLPVAGLLANAVLVPWIGVLLVPPGLIAGIWGVLRGDPEDPVLRLLRLLAEAAIELAIGFESPDVLEAARHPLPLGLGLAALGFGLRRRALGTGRRGAGLVAAAAAGVVGAELALGPVNAAAPARALFLDVGQGDAVLLQAGQRAWLIDAGGSFGAWDAGRRVVLPALRALGVRRLDALVLSHGDRDHSGGAEALLGAIPVDELWLSPPLLAHPAGRTLRARAAARGVELRVVARGDRLGSDALRLDVLWPPADARRRASNAASLVLRARSRALCLSLPGDAPAEVELQLAAEHGPCELLKLGHHGSATSSAPGWLDALRPRLAVVSAGERPRAPLPHAQLRAQLERRGVELLETRIHGAIEIRLDADPPALRTWAQAP